MCTGPFLASDDGGGVRLGGVPTVRPEQALGRGRGLGPEGTFRKGPWAGYG